MRFRYFYRLHRRWKVTPRGHPVPDPVEIVLQICFEILDRASVHARRSPVGLDSQVRFPDEPLRNLKWLSLRLQLAHSIPPRIPWLPERTHHGRPGPFAPPPLQRALSYYAPVRMPTPRRYSTPRGFSPLDALPLAALPTSGSIRASLPTFHVKAANRARVAYMPGTAWPVTGFPPDSSWNLVLAPVLMPSKTSFDTSTAIRLRSPYRFPPDASYDAFSSSLTTTVFSQRSMRWFDTTPPKGDAEGPQPSSPT